LQRLFLLRRRLFLLRRLDLLRLLLDVLRLLGELHGLLLEQPQLLVGRRLLRLLVGLLRLLELLLVVGLLRRRLLRRPGDLLRLLLVVPGELLRLLQQRLRRLHGLPDGGADAARHGPDAQDRRPQQQQRHGRRERPGDATLLVDGKETKVSATPHTFTTPDLVPGQTYYYTMTAKAERNGKPVVETQRVVVKAGETTRVEFGNLAVEGAAAAKVQIVLPADAKLYVDDQPFEATGTRTFETPKLNPGQKYYYTMKAEVRVNGEMRTETQKVTVEAGKEVTVEFAKLKSELSASR